MATAASNRLQSGKTAVKRVRFYCFDQSLSATEGTLCSFSSRPLPIALVEHPLHRLDVDLRPRGMDLEQKLDRARDRAFAVQPAAQRYGLDTKEPRQGSVMHPSSAVAGATGVDDRAESFGRHPDWVTVF